MAAAPSLFGGSCSVSRPCCRTVHSEVVRLSRRYSVEDMAFRAFLSGFGRLNGKVAHISTATTF